MQLISVLSEIYSVFWSLGRQDKFSCISTSCVFRSHNFVVSSCLRDIPSARNDLFNSCITDMRSKVCHRFFRRSSIVVRPILSGEYTCRVSQGISAFSAKHDELFTIRSFAPGMRDNVFLKHSPIIFMKFSTSSLYELSLKPSLTSTTKRVDSSPVRKKQTNPWNLTLF